MLTNDLEPGDLLRPLCGYEILKNNKTQTISFLHTRTNDNNHAYMIFLQRNITKEKYEVLLGGDVWKVAGKNIRYLKKVTP